LKLALLREERESNFTEILERYQRSKKALVSARLRRLRQTKRRLRCPTRPDG